MGAARNDLGFAYSLAAYDGWRTRDSLASVARAATGKCERYQHLIYVKYSCLNIAYRRTSDEDTCR